MTNLRIAGAQIPVSANIQKNKIEIFKAIDWAKENEVEQLVTPEGALSGYGNAWLDNLKELEDALKEVEEYQKKSRVPLHLGTMFRNDEKFGLINRNQIRHYDSDGRLYSETQKSYLIDRDSDCMAEDRLMKDRIFGVPTKDGFATMAAMICNDMWGCMAEKGKSLNVQAVECELDLIIHSTNGFKYKLMTLDDGTKVSLMPDSPGQNENKTGFFEASYQELYDVWHESWLKMTAFKANTSIITVDSCVDWDWDGDPDHVDEFLTSSPSGVVNQKGIYVTDVPRRGRQYFYYDLDLQGK